MPHFGHEPGPTCTIIDSLYHPGMRRNIVVYSVEKQLGK
jgi:hypothetical protein